MFAPLHQWKWRIPVTLLILAVAFWGTYHSKYADTSPSEPERVYFMPEGRIEVATRTEKVGTPPDETLAPESTVKHINVEDNPEALQARWEAAEKELAKQKLINASLKLKLAQETQRQAERERNEQVSELHDWAKTTFLTTTKQIEPDLKRDDELGAFALIEAQELWAEVIARVSKLDPDLQQQLIDSMRADSYYEAADLMERDLANGGVQW